MSLPTPDDAGVLRRTPPVVTPALRVPAELRLTLPPPDPSVADPAYRAALEYLYGLSPTPRPAAEIRADQPRKVARTRHLLDLWGEPQSAYPVVLVAGSKGKGSTAAMLAALLQASGVRVGRYTQPHLVSYRERVWVAGDFIPAEAVAELAGEARPLVAEAERRWPELGRYTTFEVGTALALAHFARSGVELAVVEVGVGGTHDATNVLDPLVSVIAPISADHLATLGPTLADVARAKAGILRPRRPAAVGRQVAEVAEVLEARARELDAPLAWVGRDWTWQPRGEPAASAPFDVLGPAGLLADLAVPLLGRHQRDNATLAIAAAHLLSWRGVAPTQTAVARGLAAVAWPGRVQLLPTTPPLVVDGAHNAASAERLAETLDECFPGRPLTLVVGCTRDKDLPSILAALVPLASHVVATRADHFRAARSAEVAAAARALGAAAEEAADVASALDLAAERAPSTGIVVVAGSLFVAGEALAVVDAAGELARRGAASA